MSKEIDIINDIGTPITEDTFTKYGWEKYTEDADGPDHGFHYWVLPLPVDNPDENAPSLLSSANDECELLRIPEDTYIVELESMNGLGYCQYEEEVEILYRALTGRSLPVKKETDTE